MVAFETFQRDLPDCRAYTPPHGGYRAINVRRWATIYFRLSSEEQHIARIRLGTPRWFPNSEELKRYLRDRGVPDDERDYCIDHEHWGGVIHILQDGLRTIGE